MCLTGEPGFMTLLDASYNTRSYLGGDSERWNARMMRSCALGFAPSYPLTVILVKTVGCCGLCNSEAVIIVTWVDEFIIPETTACLEGTQ